MTQKEDSSFEEANRKNVISRRLALGSSGLTLIGLLSSSIFGQDAREKPDTGLASQRQDNRVFMDRMRNATTKEERMQIMMEQRAQRQEMALESLKDELGVSNEEWLLVQPRLKAVYQLKHPLRGQNEQPSSEVEQKSEDLQGILNNKQATAAQIKTGLTALRVAKEKACQELIVAQRKLCEIMTLRQEAMLVLKGLLE
ncbi:MAG: hypothetical protein K9N55_20350 [Phycisphaerae bacterium]|nr:hypothetical protein [Phycisphaerae bacterium]